MIEPTPPPKVLGLSLAGELDLTSRDELTESLAKLESADIAELDFSKVTYVDSTILGCLAVLRGRLVENGGLGVIRILGPSPSMVRILSISGLNKVFEVSGLEGSNAYAT